MDPLLSLGTLAANVEHTVGQVADDEGRFGDTGGLDTRSEHILIAGKIVGLSDARDGIKVAIGKQDQSVIQVKSWSARVLQPR